MLFLDVVFFDLFLVYHQYTWKQQQKESDLTKQQQRQTEKESRKALIRKEIEIEQSFLPKNWVMIVETTRWMTQ